LTNEYILTINLNYPLNTDLQAYHRRHQFTFLQRRINYLLWLFFCHQTFSDRLVLWHKSY